MHTHKTHLPIHKSTRTRLTFIFVLFFCLTVYEIVTGLLFPFTLYLYLCVRVCVSLWISEIGGAAANGSTQIVVPNSTQTEASRQRVNLRRLLRMAPLIGAEMCLKKKKKRKKNEEKIERNIWNTDVWRMFPITLPPLLFLLFRHGEQSLSPIHMQMPNQAVQSGSISVHPTTPLRPKQSIYLGER